ncbi:Rieske (2Fe-2S) protein [Streptomyces racemochromogenes]|uniref:Cytochrome bc1 complex Rieske iron-sulfur subunit n=1 Tax=Streptomyces racemochromogenes TaxID=67353 RepID=A0ABW7PNE3_9ACTN
MTDSQTARRTVLAAGAAALAGGTLAACGGGENKSATEPTGPQAPSAAASAPPSAPTGSAPQQAAKPLVDSSKVPVGGGTVLKEAKLVVTQPTAGSFRCFSAVCPHQGCLVNKVADGTIDCPCHGSRFQVADGAVTHGPATRGLEEKKIVVAPNGEISLA